MRETRGGSRVMGLRMVDRREMLNLCGSLLNESLKGDPKEVLDICYRILIACRSRFYELGQKRLLRVIISITMIVEKMLLKFFQYFKFLCIIYQMVLLI